MRIVKEGDTLHYPANAFRNFHPEVMFSGNPSVSILENYGWKVLESDPEPTAGRYEVVQRGTVEWRDGTPYWTWIVRPMSQAEKEAKIEEEFQELNRERERRIAIGSSFTVTESQANATANAVMSEPIPLTGRPLDQTVYLALLTRAQGYKAAGVTDPIMKIRDGSDNIQMLTPEQMIELVSQSMTWFEDVMEISWKMKDKTEPFANGIPEDYTSDVYWPQ